MNSTQIVRADADRTGVMLRLWIDDEEQRHVAVAELRLGVKTLRSWLADIDQAHNDEDQEQLPYE